MFFHRVVWVSGHHRQQQVSLHQLPRFACICVMHILDWANLLWLQCTSVSRSIGTIRWSSDRWAGLRREFIVSWWRVMSRVSQSTVTICSRSHPLVLALVFGTSSVCVLFQSTLVTGLVCIVNWCSAWWAGRGSKCTSSSTQTCVHYVWRKHWSSNSGSICLAAACHLFCDQSAAVAICQLTSTTLAQIQSFSPAAFCSLKCMLSCVQSAHLWPVSSGCNLSAQLKGRFSAGLRPFESITICQLKRKLSAELHSVNSSAVCQPICIQFAAPLHSFSSGWSISAYFTCRLSAWLQSDSSAEICQLSSFSSCRLSIRWDELYFEKNQKILIVNCCIGHGRGCTGLHWSEQCLAFTNPHHMMRAETALNHSHCCGQAVKMTQNHGTRCKSVNLAANVTSCTLIIFGLP